MGELPTIPKKTDDTDAKVLENQEENNANEETLKNKEQAIAEKEKNVRSKDSNQNQDIFIEYSAIKELRKVSNFDTIINLLNNQKRNNVSSRMEKIIDTNIEAINDIQEEIDIIQKTFNENKNEKDQKVFLKNMMENRKDPFEAIARIKDTELKEQALKLIFRDRNVNFLFIFMFSIKNNQEKVDWLKSIANKTKNKELKTRINNFVDGYEDLKKEESANKEKTDKWLDMSKGLAEQIDLENINWDSQFKKDKVFKHNLQKGFKKYVLEEEEKEKEDFGENNDNQNIDSEEDIEKTFTYENLAVFYKKHLAKKDDSIFEDIELPDDYDTDTMIKEIESVLPAMKDDETISLAFKKLHGILTLKQRAEKENTPVPVIEKEKNDVKPQETTEKDLLFSLDSDKKETIESEKKDSLWNTIKETAIDFATITGLNTIDVGFSIIASMIFSPVTAAIWLSRARVDAKGGKIKTNDWKDLLISGAFEETKEEKKK